MAPLAGSLPLASFSLLPAETDAPAPAPSPPPRWAAAAPSTMRSDAQPPPKRPSLDDKGAVEKGAKAGDKSKPATEKEKHLLAQIKELERRLLTEQRRKKEQAKALSATSARRLFVCSQWLPFTIERNAEGKFEVPTRRMIPRVSQSVRLYQPLPRSIGSLARAHHPMKG